MPITNTRKKYNALDYPSVYHTHNSLCSINVSTVADEVHSN